jgi:hypothetical protein
MSRRSENTRRRCRRDGRADPFVPLPRIRTHRKHDASGKYRWYNDYRLPQGGQVTVRLHGNEQVEPLAAVADGVGSAEVEGVVEGPVMTNSLTLAEHGRAGPSLEQAA